MSPGDLDFHSEYPKHAISDVFFKQINDDCNGTKETACCFQGKKKNSCPLDLGFFLLNYLSVLTDFFRLFENYLGVRTDKNSVKSSPFLKLNLN